MQSATTASSDFVTIVTKTKFWFSSTYKYTKMDLFCNTIPYTSGLLYEYQDIVLEL